MRLVKTDIIGVIKNDTRKLIAEEQYLIRKLSAQGVYAGYFVANITHSSVL